MGLDKIKIILIFFISLFLFFPYADASAGNPSGGKILTIKTAKNTSLSELITSSGYDINDKNVYFFLRDFVSLNRDIKSLSMISKGTSVRLPLKYLTVKGRKITPYRKVIKRAVTKKEASHEYQKEQDAIFKSNVKILLDSLTEGTSIIFDGIKVFSISDKSELSFNTSFFPLIKLSDKRLIMIDYRGILPEEIKDIIEISWPEYKIISNGEKDIKKIYSLLLDSIGYSLFKDVKIIFVGKAKIEFFTDFVIMKKSEDILEGEFTAINIIKPDEYRTPDEFKKWAENRKIRIIELFLRDPPLSKGVAEIVYMSEKEVDKFSERFLTLLGYEFNRGVYFRLSDRKEYEFNIKADLSITSGRRAKIIDFSEISEPVIRYAKKRGFDMINVEPRERRSEVVRKIMELLSINYKDKPDATSYYITPKGIRYRVIAPGILVKLKNGLFFLVDSEVDARFLSNLVNDNLTIVKF